MILREISDLISVDPDFILRPFRSDGDEFNLEKYHQLTFFVTFATDNIQVPKGFNSYFWTSEGIAENILEFMEQKKILPQYVRTIKSNKSNCIKLSNSQEITVTMFDDEGITRNVAYHFKTHKGNAIYMGHFRNIQFLEQNQMFSDVVKEGINYLYVDNYRIGSSHYEMYTVVDVMREIQKTLLEYPEYKLRINAPLFGSEEFVQKLLATNNMISINDSIQKLYKVYEDGIKFYHHPEAMIYFIQGSDNVENLKIYFLEDKMITVKLIDKCESKLPEMNKDLGLISIFYSQHANEDETRQIIQLIQPQNLKEIYPEEQKIPNFLKKVSLNWNAEHCNDNNTLMHIESFSHVTNCNYIAASQESDLSNKDYNVSLNESSSNSTLTGIIGQQLSQIPPQFKQNTRNYQDTECKKKKIITHQENQEKCVAEIKLENLITPIFTLNQECDTFFGTSYISRVEESENLVLLSQQLPPLAPATRKFDQKKRIINDEENCKNLSIPRNSQSVPIMNPTSKISIKIMEKADASIKNRIENEFINIFGKINFQTSNNYNKSTSHNSNLQRATSKSLFSNSNNNETPSITSLGEENEIAINFSQHFIRNKKLPRRKQRKKKIFEQNEEINTKEIKTHQENQEKRVPEIIPKNLCSATNSQSDIVHSIPLVPITRKFDQKKRIINDEENYKNLSIPRNSQSVPIMNSTLNEDFDTFTSCESFQNNNICDDNLEKNTDDLIVIHSESNSSEDDLQVNAVEKTPQLKRVMSPEFEKTVSYSYENRMKRTLMESLTRISWAFPIPISSEEAIEDENDNILKRNPEKLLIPVQIIGKRKKKSENISKFEYISEEEDDRS